MKNTQIAVMCLVALVLSFLVSCSGPGAAIQVPGGTLRIGGGYSEGGGYGGGGYNRQPIATRQQFDEEDRDIVADRRQVVNHREDGGYRQQGREYVDGYSLQVTRDRVFQARIYNARGADRTKADHVQHELADHANKTWEKTKVLLSEEDASAFATEKLGYSVRAGVRKNILSGSDRTVTYEKVDIKDVPAHIRAKYEGQ